MSREVEPATNPLQVAVRLPRAADLLDIKLDTFNRYVRPHLKLLIIGNAPLVTVAELSRWANENSQHVLD